MSNYTVGIRIEGTDAASPAFNRVQQEIKNTGTNANESGNSIAGFAKKLGSLQDIAEKAATAFAGMFIIQKVGELVELGVQANKAESTFTQMTASIGGVNSVLAAMRSSTGGVVDDMTLMEGANKLLITGLASTKEQTAEFIDIAVTMGSAMGQDAAGAIDNFNAAMMNMSYERLDTLGISAGRVRERVRELKEEGYATDEAFKMAVLEQGRLAMEKLGPAAEASATSMGKFQTMWNNFMQDVGQGTANVLNAAATSLDQIIQLGQIATGNHEIQQQQRAEVQALAENYLDTFLSSFDEQTRTSTGSQSLLIEWLSTAYKAVEADPTLLESRDRLIKALVTVPDYYREAAADGIYSVFEQQSITQASQAATQVLADQSEAMAQASVDAYWGAYEQYWGAYADPAYQRQNQLLQQAGVTQATIVAGNEKLAQVQRQAELDRGYDAYTAMWRRQQSIFEQDQAAAARAQAEMAAEMRQNMIMDAQADAESFGNLFEQAGRFITDSDMLALNDSFLSIQNAFDAGLIPESEYDRLKGMADEAGRMHDSLMDIDLSAIFGQTSGGLQGQMTDSVIAQMRASGASDEEISAMERQLNLSSGRENAASLAYEEQIVPLIATMSPEDAVKAIQNLDALIGAAMEMDLSPDQIAMLLNAPGATGFTQGVGQNITVRPGDTVNMLAAQYGMTPQEFMQATNTSDPRLLQVGSYNAPGMQMGMGPYDPYSYINSMFAGQGLMAGQDAVAGGPGSGTVDPSKVMEDVSVAADAAALSAEAFTANLSGAVTQAETVVSTLDVINTTPYTAQIDIKVNDPTGALALILSGATIAVAGGPNPRDNGGRASGVDGRVGQSAGSTPRGGR